MSKTVTRIICANLIITPALGVWLNICGDLPGGECKVPRNIAVASTSASSDAVFAVNVGEAPASFLESQLRPGRPTDPTNGPGLL